MAQQGSVGRGKTVFWCGHFEKPKFSAIILGDMMFQLINPFIKEESLQNYHCSRLESVDMIYSLSIQVQPVVYGSSNLHDHL